MRGTKRLWKWTDGGTANNVQCAPGLQTPPWPEDGVQSTDFLDFDSTPWRVDHQLQVSTAQRRVGLLRAPLLPLQAPPCILCQLVACHHNHAGARKHRRVVVDGQHDRLYRINSDGPGAGELSHP